jgi:hypothetical protein
MKNTEIKKGKKQFTIVTIIILLVITVLFLLVAGLYQNNRTNLKVIGQESKESVTKEGDIALTEDEENKLYLRDYDDIVNSPPVTSKSITENTIKYSDDSDVETSSADNTDSDIDKTGVADDSTSEGSSGDDTFMEDQTDTAIITQEDNKTVIDESPSTMVDKTGKNEYKGDENQQSIEFFDVEPSGADVNGDVPAGGKQNVGTWN